ncbi:protein EMBRYONIC FLOWER 1 isoform X2 [Prunus yedoensis var. nudiflora]|uniref:Protein EMBRYONIC FLOWER 1 isoform X2 n=1 Tax=Prunus yedoensis var. nudiflora TaxID=2094558 RepID=A0A314Y6M8_PRUYE|nr:protein EMBRYONIC FLOWER 1 isoform X2 [Prunus yedoensis var. nudiflora]
MVDKADNATKLQTDACHPLVLDECDYASSENFDKSSGLSRKKSRKVRLLSELVNKGDAKTDCIRIEDSPSNTISNISGAGIVSQGQVSVQENARVGLSDNKRRKFPEEEEQGCLETSHPKSLNKKLKAFRRDEETTNAIAESVLEEDAVARPSLQADEKSNWNRHENERIPAVGKKKIKKCNDFGTCSSLVPPEDNVPIEACGQSWKFKQGGIDQIPFPASEAEGKSGICKRKGKMPKVDNGQASLFPWNGMFRTSPKTREDVEIMHTGHPFHLAEDASAEKGLDLSLNSYLAAERCGKKSIPQSEDGFPSLSTWKDGSCKLDVFMRKNVEANYAANLKPSKSI